MRSYMYKLKWTKYFKKKKKGKKGLVRIFAQILPKCCQNLPEHHQNFAWIRDICNFSWGGGGGPSPQSHMTMLHNDSRVFTLKIESSKGLSWLMRSCHDSVDKTMDSQSRGFWFNPTSYSSCTLDFLEQVFFFFFLLSLGENWKPSVPSPLVAIKLLLSS